MSTGLIGVGVFILVIAGTAATTIDQHGPWATIIMAGTGLLCFITGIVLRIIERH